MRLLRTSRIVLYRTDGLQGLPLRRREPGERLVDNTAVPPKRPPPVPIHKVEWTVVRIAVTVPALRIRDDRTL